VEGMGTGTGGHRNHAVLGFGRRTLAWWELPPASRHAAAHLQVAPRDGLAAGAAQHCKN
jgi:hypothetical protein